MSISLSFRTEEETRELLDQIATSLDRNRNWIINEAITQYIDLYKWQLEEIEKGIADSIAGRTYTTGELKKHFAKLTATAKAKK